MCKSVQFELNQDVVEADGISTMTFGVTCGDYIVKDLSDNQVAVQNLVKLLNQLQPEPRHLESIVEDFLNRPSLKGDKYFPLGDESTKSF